MEKYFFHYSKDFNINIKSMTIMNFTLMAVTNMTIPSMTITDMTIPNIYITSITINNTNFYSGKNSKYDPSICVIYFYSIQEKAKTVLSVKSNKLANFYTIGLILAYQNRNLLARWRNEK